MTPRQRVSAESALSAATSGSLIESNSTISATFSVVITKIYVANRVAIWGEFDLHSRTRAYGFGCCRKWSLQVQ